MTRDLSPPRRSIEDAADSSELDIPPVWGSLPLMVGSVFTGIALLLAAVISMIMLFPSIEAVSGTSPILTSGRSAAPAPAFSKQVFGDQKELGQGDLILTPSADTGFVFAWIDGSGYSGAVDGSDTNQSAQEAESPALIASISLTTGEEKWRVDLRHQLGIEGPVLMDVSGEFTGGVVITLTAGADVSYVVVLDPVTGKTIFNEQIPGNTWATSVIKDRIVVQGYDDEGPLRVAVYDITDGSKPLWDALCGDYPCSVLGTDFVTTGSGVVNMTDGSPASFGRKLEPGERFEQVGDSDLIVKVTDEQAGKSKFMAWDVTSDKPLWDAPVVALNFTARDGSYLVGGDNPTQTQRVDPQTGKALWSARANIYDWVQLETKYAGVEFRNTLVRLDSMSGEISFSTPLPCVYNDGMASIENAALVLCDATVLAFDNEKEAPLWTLPVTHTSRLLQSGERAVLYDYNDFTLSVFPG